MVKEVEFLSQWVTPQGASPLKEKLKAVRSWERPQIMKDVRSFLGFVNYPRCFISKYAEIATPLMYLTKKDVEMQWGPPQQQAFQQLKDALCDAPMLIFPDPKLPDTVVTDASGIAAGVVLMQDQGDGPRPIAFMSRTLKPTE